MTSLAPFRFAAGQFASPDAEPDPRLQHDPLGWRAGARREQLPPDDLIDFGRQVEALS